MNSAIQILSGKRTFAILMIMTLAGLPAYGAVQEGEQWEEAKASSAGLWRLTNRIKGVWNAKVNITVCATGATITTFDALGLFAGDGTFADTNSVNPILRSSAFGNWKHIRGRNYKFAFRSFRFDTMGTYLGSQIVRHNVVLSSNGKSYKSEGTAEFYDTDGNLFMTGCSDSTATRFK